MFTGILTLKVMASDEHNDRPQGQADTGLPVACVWLHLSMVCMSNLQHFICTNLIIIAVSLDQVLGVDVQIETVLCHQVHGAGPRPGNCSHYCNHRDT